MKIYKISEIAILKKNITRYATTAKEAIEIVNERRYAEDKTAENRDTGESVNINEVLNENDITHYIFYTLFGEILVDEVEVEE